MRPVERKALGSKSLKGLTNRLASERFARGSDEDLAMRPVERKALSSKTLHGLARRFASERFARGSDEDLAMARQGACLVHRKAR